jgi:hypothetical protein
MTLKTFLTIGVITFSLNGLAQKPQKTDVYFEHLQVHYEFSKIGDTLLLNDLVYEKDSISSAKFTLTDYYGSYNVLMKYKGLEKSITYCYQGSKNKFFIANVPVFNELGVKTKTLHRKTFAPIRLENCGQKK